ncbi:hypothetical protein [Pseudaestuariivita rosea]|uniref:hypothetical protein n=1 Tax=Pseudaestuariivita rosea TaxID=2763263 RepID=UPI001ABB5176|nr:hypothetical protein [Pseudaestuariivita rosea]
MLIFTKLARTSHELAGCYGKKLAKLYLRFLESSGVVPLSSLLKRLDLENMRFIPDDLFDGFEATLLIIANKHTSLMLTVLAPDIQAMIQMVGDKVWGHFRTRT